MAWTTPRTWVTGETVTAALMNTHIRDNFRETSPFTVTTTGDISYADAANSMNSRLAIGAALTHMTSTGSAPVWRAPATDDDTGSGSDNTTSYLNLGHAQWGFASDIEVSVTTGTAALVLFEGRLSNDTGGSTTFLSYSVSSATTVAANDAHAIWYESSNAADTARFGGYDFRTGLTAGSNVFTLEGRADANTGTILRPELFVLPF